MAHPLRSLRRTIGCHDLKGHTRLASAPLALPTFTSTPPPGTSSSTPLITDPLFALGPDIFHMVLRDYLTVGDILKLEQVCVAWRNFSTTNGSLWRHLCIQQRIDPEDISRWDTHLRSMGPPLNFRLTAWRPLCLDLVPKNAAWKTGCVEFHSVPYPVSWASSASKKIWGLKRAKAVKPTAAQVAVIECGMFVCSNSDNTLTLNNTGGGVLDTVTDVLPYNHLEALGTIVVGMRTNNHFGIASPEPNPTVIEIWEVIFTPKGASLALAKDIPDLPIWGYSIRLHGEWCPKTGAPLVVLAVLASNAKKTGTYPQTHWRAVCAERSVHLWYLSIYGEIVKSEKINVSNIGRVQSLDLDTQHIFLPSTTDLHIYSRATAEHLVTLPIPPEHAAMAVNFKYKLKEKHLKEWDGKAHLPRRRFQSTGVPSTNDMYLPIMSSAHGRAKDFRAAKNAKCCRSRTSLVVASPSGALVIIRDYRQLLSAMASIPVQKRAAAAIRHTVVATMGHPIADLATYRNRIVIRMDHCGQSLVFLDENDVPSIAYDNRIRWERKHGVKKKDPKINFTVIQMPIPREGSIWHGMHANASGIYVPGKDQLSYHHLGSMKALSSH